MENNSGPIPTIETVVDLEAAIVSFETDIRTAVEASTTETQVRRVTNPRGELPFQTQQLIKDRRRAKRRAARSGHPQDKLTVNQLNRRVKAALQEHHQARWQQHLESLDPQDQSLWKTQRALRTARKAMPPIHGETGIVYTKEEKAETLVDSLELQCRENFPLNEDEDHIEAVERRVSELMFVPDDEEIRHVTPDEIKDIVGRLKTRKASGCDHIGNLVLRKLPRKGIVAMVNITNAILRLRHFPERWKKADVILIPKPGKNLTFPSSYRPISLLPAMSKVTERAILARLKEKSDELHVIPDEQFAYRSGHSTESQVLRLVETITEGFNRRQFTAAIFLDVAKAFDRVWHRGLIAKMMDAGYPTAMVKLIRSYLRGRSLRTKVEGALSTYRPMEAGVPQGTVLSPHLFNIFTSDIPRTHNTSKFLYADDTAIIARSTRATMAARYLQRAINQLEDWCNRWKVSINPDKSRVILFARRPPPRDFDQTDIQFDGEAIEWTDNVNYLGVTLDRRLTWKDHVSNVVKKAKMTRAKLYPMLCSRSELNLRNKVLLIKTVIQPQLTYASPAWGYAAETHLKKLQAVENIALRTATGAPWFIRNRDIQRDLEYKTAREVIKTRAEKLFATAEAHSNPLIRAAVDYGPEEATRHKRPRLQLLDAG